MSANGCATWARLKCPERGPPAASTFSTHEGRTKGGGRSRPWTSDDVLARDDPAARGCPVAVTRHLVAVRCWHGARISVQSVDQSPGAARYRSYGWLIGHYRDIHSQLARASVADRADSGRAARRLHREPSGLRRQSSGAARRSQPILAAKRPRRKLERTRSVSWRARRAKRGLARGIHEIALVRRTGSDFDLLADGGDTCGRVLSALRLEPFDR